MSHSKESSALSIFLRQMQITPSMVEIVQDNARSTPRPLPLRTRPHLVTSSISKQSSRWLASDELVGRPVYLPSSSIDQILQFKRRAEFSRKLLQRQHSDQIDPPLLPRRRESYDDNDNARTRPTKQKRNLHIVTATASSKIDEDMSPSKPRRRLSLDPAKSDNKKPMKARAA
eukprot:scaffold276_cov132-Cylindrotheca_fusiformis.AAC.10